MPALTVAQLAAVCGGQMEGNGELAITGANTLENASEKEISFVATVKAESQARASRAACLIVNSSFSSAGNGTLIRVSDPRLAFAAVLQAIYPKPKWEPQIHPTAVIAPSAYIAASCFIGANVSVGENAKISDGCYIGDGSSIGADVAIGTDSTLYAHVTIYRNVTVGARVILHSGCVLGADGFGFTPVDGRYQKFPQVGTVLIEDDVEIGANSCVDRAALGVTRIGEGSKLDNLVHVGHNCNIGRHVAIAAQVGFSGGVTVGDWAVIGGQAGFGERSWVAPRGVVGGKSGVLVGQKVDAGEPVWGIPARPLRQHLKGLANVNKISELREQVRSLKSTVAELSKASSETDAE